MTSLNQRVRVHFNLHTHRWSVTAMEGINRGRVVEHADNFALTDCRFVVSEAGRQRVLANQCRQVHAWVEGRVAPAVTEPPAGATEFTYNPYRAATFTRRASGEAITTAPACWFIGRRALVAEKGEVK